MEPNPDVRIDKWLWAVRLYKTRSLAANSCVLGRVEVNGKPVKPSRSVHLGETITAVTGEIKRTLRVTGLIEKRVGAKLISGLYEDLTPASEYEKPRLARFGPVPIKPMPKRFRK